MYQLKFAAVFAAFFFATASLGWSQAVTPVPGSVSEETPDDARSPLFVGITIHRRPVTTDSPMAQRYFDQGINLMFAFNHDEAVRSFQQALRYDPSCAMAWWGIAICRGPHINNPLMDEPSSRAAWNAIEKAKALRDNANPVERALIDALAQRYVADVQQNIEDRESLNKKYAAAMQQVHQQFPDDVDVTMLAAESLMDLRPWDLWSDDGEPRPETPEIVSLLESVLEMQPDHPGANHLYIHAIEASPKPEQAMAAADRLRTLMPGSGHMVHMPSHIDVRTGKWTKAAQQNETAIKTHLAYLKASPEQGFYKVYMLHNPHFLSFVSMMEGRQEQAIKSAREMLNSIPPEVVEQSAALVDPYMAIEYQALIRFGQWEQMLKLPAPPESLPITTAMWRFCRATALAAQGKISDAEAEQKLFQQAADAIPEETYGAINPAHEIMDVARHTLAGEIAFQKGDIDTAVEELRKGVVEETELLYMEPPEWIQPVRHSLGAILVAAERWKEAEEVYRADLKEWPENGWALYGLMQCLEAQNDTSGAKEIGPRFRAAWSRADTPIDVTCLCVRGNE